MFGGRYINRTFLKTFFIICNSVSVLNTYILYNVIIYIVLTKKIILIYEKSRKSMKIVVPVDYWFKGSIFNSGQQK